MDPPAGPAVAPNPKTDPALYENRNGYILGASITLLLLPTLAVTLRLLSRRMYRAGFWVSAPSATTWNETRETDIFNNSGMTLPCFWQWYELPLKNDMEVVVKTDDSAAIRLGSLHHHDPQLEPPATDQSSPVDTCRFPSCPGPSSPLPITSRPILIFQVQLCFRISVRPCHGEC